MPVEEVIHDGVEGVLVPMDDHHRLAQRVLALLANPHLRDQFSQAARQAALAWDQAVTLPKLASLIEGSFEMASHSQTPLHHQANLDLLRLLPSVPRLVEAGCSSGLAVAYRQSNPQCHWLGIEIDPNYADIARAHCDQVLVADLDSLAYCGISHA